MTIFDCSRDSMTQHKLLLIRFLKVSVQKLRTQITYNCMKCNKIVEYKMLKNSHSVSTKINVKKLYTSVKLHEI